MSRRKVVQRGIYRVGKERKLMGDTFVNGYNILYDKSKLLISLLNICYNYSK